MPSTVESTPAHAVDVTLDLRGGHRVSLCLPPDALALRQLRQLAAGDADPRPGLMQLPLDDGRRSLSVCSTDIRQVRFPRAGEHPAMNTHEGHLGGYISARHPRAAELGTMRGDPATWTPRLWQWICDALKVRSVLDIGCGEGHAAAFFRTLGCRVRGVDGSPQAQRDTVLGDDHIMHDYNAGPLSLSETFELVWSCEFVEHVHAAYEDNFLDSFAQASRYLFMTAAPPGQPGWHHVNCQLPDYWITRIEARGLRYEAEMTRRARALAGKGHFANQGLVFTRAV